MTHLLDTDHLSILERPGGTGYAILVANLAAHGPADVGLSVVSVHEQFRGAHAKINRARTPAEVIDGYDLLVRVLAHAARFPVVPFGPAEAAVFGGLTAQKVQVKTMDRRIASTALANNLTLVTRNTADFARVPGLRLADWTR